MSDGDPRGAPEGSDAERLAAESVAAMWAGDAASRALGMTVEETGPGRAVVAMTVRADMVNGFGSAHGGLIASLADSAFAFACNSGGTVTVAAGFDIVFLAPAQEGDRLVARAEERSRAGRSGLYDVTVTRSDGTVVAEFRGRSRSLGRPIPGVAGQGPSA